MKRRKFSGECPKIVSVICKFHYDYTMENQKQKETGAGEKIQQAMGLLWGGLAAVILISALFAAFLYSRLHF